MGVKYAIYRGVGNDGGFGDYGGTSWDELPVRDDEGNFFSFASMEEAEQAARELSNRARTAFYSVGYHDTYDGNFPNEYEARIIPELGPDTFWPEVVDAVSKLHADAWVADVYYGYNEDDEDE